MSLQEQFRMNDEVKRMFDTVSRLADLGDWQKHDAMLKEYDSINSAYREKIRELTNKYHEVQEQQKNRER